MKPRAYDRDGDFGYPTLKEFRSNRRTYLARMLKCLGVAALGDVGIVNCGSKKEKETLHGDGVAPPAQKLPGEATVSGQQPGCQAEEIDPPAPERIDIQPPEKNGPRLETEPLERNSQITGRETVGPPGPPPPPSLSGGERVRLSGSPPSLHAYGENDAIIFIASIPAVADVFNNGKLIGKTNVSELVLPAGVLTLRFEKGDKSTTREFTLKPGKNPSQLVTIP